MHLPPKIAAVVLLCAAITACGHKKTPHAAKAVPRPIGATESGIASWYGNPYHGRRAANGEIYDMEQWTAAHRTLPFGTWVRVKNLDNGKTVEVRITDRGPFINKRIIDLSRAAARDIDMIGPGTAKVKITIIRGPSRHMAARTPAPVMAKPEPPPPPTEPEPEPPAAVTAPGFFAVQVGAFADKGNAERLRASMEKRYGSARLVQQETTGRHYRVLVGHEPGEAEAEALAGRIRTDSPESANAFIVRIDGE
jgi:rare lipoprotein A